MRSSFILTLFLQWLGFQALAQNELMNAANLSLPLTNKKMVIAHNMTHIIQYKDHDMEDGCNPKYYGVTGNSTATLGGYTQVVPVAALLMKEASLDSSVAFELHNAIAAGIDGFQFYYTLGNPSSDEIIKAYFRIADKQRLDFKFTFCISHPKEGKQEDKIKVFAERMNNIIKTVGRSNPHWLRTPAGSLILYMWYGEQLADIPTNAALPEAYYAANAYKKLGSAIGEELTCVYSINEQITPEKLNQVFDYFPACWVWTIPFSDHYIGSQVAALARLRHRTFTGSVFGDFYTSKLLHKNTWDMFPTAAAAVDAGINKVERKYIATGLSYNFRKLFEFGIQQDISIMNVITWNDYPEGHHLAPELNHNDGFSILLNYYKSLWIGDISPFNNKDLVVVFFKKYNHRIKPYPFYIKLVEIEKAGVDAASEDSIEVITILKAPARLHLNGDSMDLSAGFQVAKFAAKLGNVVVDVIRNKNKIIHFVTPEAITNHPLRTDRLTYCFSNEAVDYYKQNNSVFEPYLPVAKAPKPSSKN